MLEDRVCIVGLGLMGGSLALALRPYLSNLSIVDTNPETRAAAHNVADFVTGDLAEGVRQADLIVLAAPVRTILQLLADLPAVRPDGCLVMDLGSTKAEICQTMAALPPSFQAIGGHPMCGKETAGFGNAAPQLFADETFVLCENGRTTAHMKAVANEIVEKIGANLLYLAPQIHDEMVAATSHLPYLVSATLLQTAAGQNNEQLWQVSASGFRDTTRLAGSDPQMLLDILLTNGTAVLNQIEVYQNQLSKIKRLLSSANERELARWLEKVKKSHNEYRSSSV